MNDNDVCGKLLCRKTRRAHVWTNHGIAHAFVELAPQPPADATLRVGARHAVPREALEAIDAQVKDGLPAGPPVTGEGDEAVSDEVIAAEMALEELDTFGQPEDENALAGIILRGIARGRVLGARDAFEEAAKAAERRGNDDAGDSIREITRRAGREGK